MDGTAFYGSIVCSKAFPSLSVLPTFEFVEWNMFLSLAIMLLNSKSIIYILFLTCQVIQNFSTTEGERCLDWEDLHSRLCNLKAIHTWFSHFKGTDKEEQERTAQQNKSWPRCGCGVLFWEFLAQNTTTVTAAFFKTHTCRAFPHL